MNETIQWIAALIFGLAIVHTFSTRFFERLAHERPQHAGMWHLLGEVEVVFGFWAMVLVIIIAALQGTRVATEYVDSRDYTEPMFVFAIMVIAGSRAVLQVVRAAVARAAKLLPTSDAVGLYFLSLSVLPLTGSLITEPAAMTLAALMLREQVYRRAVSARLKYGTLGVLFVNISIGGTLTPFAAPPVLMVADTWNWDAWHMLSNFGWKAALAVGVNAAAAAFLFRRELAGLPPPRKREREPVPPGIVFIHLLLLAGVVAFAHHPPVFLALLLFFLGFAAAYPQFQDRVMLREGLLVAFFLAGLVVLGGQQQWWLDPLLRGMDADLVFPGAIVLTAFTDNAALTYLASLVQGLSDEFKYSIVAGAVTGGGLTVIANAPNPAGFSILRRHFDDEAVHPLGLLAAALAPTLTAMLAFRLL
jgi:hypothetical protein